MEEAEFEKLSKGTILSGRYEIIGEIGEGGFAVVYEGTDVELGRLIAIKVLNIASFSHDPSAKANVVERFRREGKTAARINHPNAVAIYDFGETPDGWPFIVMERLTGYDLDVEIDEHGTLSPERAVRLFAPCLEALGKAHELGVVHKDLKPGNLFLCDPRTEEERLVILDFGVARINSGEDASRLTTDGQILGTPQYMAPEYIESQTAGPTLDVYQMGLILTESLTGTPVVNEENMVTCLILHTTGQLRIASEVLEGSLGEVIETATALKHTDRYANGYDFQSALLEVHPTGDALEMPSDGRQAVLAKTEIVPREKKSEAPIPAAVPGKKTGLSEKAGGSENQSKPSVSGFDFKKLGIIAGVILAALFFGVVGIVALYLVFKS